MFDRAVKAARHRVPLPVRVALRRTALEAHNARLRLTVPVRARCPYVNVYHCAVRKTASQWIKALFSDAAVYRHSGLLPYDPRFYGWRDPRLCPPGRTALSLFLSRKRFDAVPKPDRYRAFFVYRDPRDVVVSSYFSTRDSHAPMGDVLAVRRVLREKPRKEGMIHLIGDLAAKGRFRALRSWTTGPPDPAVRLVRYEDLTGPRQPAEVDALLRHCGIVLPPPELTALLDRYSFTRMAGRARPGAVSHYRCGVPGDWRNHFDDDVRAAFAEATGDLVERLGYPP